MADMTQNLHVVPAYEKPALGIYGFGGPERLHIEPRTLVLASIALGEAQGFRFALNGDTVGIIASRAALDDQDYIRRLHTTMESLVAEDRPTIAHFTEFVGGLGAISAQALLRMDLADALNFAQDTDLTVSQASQA